MELLVVVLVTMEILPQQMNLMVELVEEVAADNILEILEERAVMADYMVEVEEVVVQDKHLLLLVVLEETE